MTELEKAARMALEALDEIHAGKRHPQLALAVAHNLRKALTQALATAERVPNRCAQCKKEYRQNATSIGCPKCAPGVRVSEDEFQKPIATTERKGELSDREIWRLWDSQERPGLVGGPCPVKFARDLLANTSPQVPESKGGPVYMTASAFFEGTPYNWREVSKDFYDTQEDRCRRVLYTSPQVPEDTERLDWIERQHLEELTMGLAIDCEHDGQYYVCGDSNKTGYGDSLREAIDAARKGE